MPGNRPVSYEDDASCRVGLPAHHGSCSLDQRPAGWGRAEPRAVKQGLGVGGRTGQGWGRGEGGPRGRGAGTTPQQGCGLEVCVRFVVVVAPEFDPCNTCQL